MNKYLKKYIKVVNREFIMEDNIIQQITNTDEKTLTNLIIRMDETQIINITDMLFGDNFLIETTPSPNNTKPTLRNKAKQLWANAVSSASNVVTGRTLSKLKGLAARISNVNSISKQWVKYKSRFNIDNDTGTELYKFYKVNFPYVSDDTLKKSFNNANVNINGTNQIDDIGSLITTIAKTVGEEAVVKVNNHSLGDSNQQNDMQQNSNFDNDSPGQQEPTKAVVNDNKAVERALYDLEHNQNMARRDIANTVALISKLHNARDLLNNKHVARLLATVGYYAIKNK